MGDEAHDCEKLPGVESILGAQSGVKEFEDLGVQKVSELPECKGRTYSIYICERHGGISASEPCTDFPGTHGYVFVVIGRGLVGSVVCDQIVEGLGVGRVLKVVQSRDMER
jgi:hypothetical protein